MSRPCSGSSSSCSTEPWSSAAGTSARSRTHSSSRITNRWDSFLVGLAAFYPQSWLKPQLIPWNPAAAENFYKNPLLAWLADNWKCIWVREGRHDLHALHRMIRSEEHTSELQSLAYLVCRLLLEKK